MPDFDEFDDAFDDADDLGDFDALFASAEDYDTPGLRSPAPEAASVAARVLVEGETGVQFDALALFAEPLFQRYGLDLAEAFALKAAPAEGPPEVLALLETARVLWAFFALPPAERAHRHNALAAHLVGPDPGEEDWLDVEGLLGAVEPYWQAMLPEERAAAEQTGSPLLGFDALLAHPAFCLDGPHGAQAYGPDALSEVEARALFAQPLLDDPATLTDADAFEHALERANAYWTLAQTAPGAREAALAKAIEQLTNGSGERAAVEAEARRMVERFHHLFPGHADEA